MPSPAPMLFIIPESQFKAFPGQIRRCSFTEGKKLTIILFVWMVQLFLKKIAFQGELMGLMSVLSIDFNYARLIWR
jgi:hypothetical protein